MAKSCTVSGPSMIQKLRAMEPAKPYSQNILKSYWIWVDTYTIFQNRIQLAIATWKDRKTASYNYYACIIKASSVLHPEKKKEEKKNKQQMLG